VAAACVVMIACQSEPSIELPPVHRPLGYDTVRISLTSCPVPLPPVRADFNHCPPDSIGKTISEEKVCRMLSGLRDWINSVPLDSEQVQRGDWERVQAVTVCRHAIKFVEDNVTRWQTTIEADVSERPRLFFVELWDHHNEMRFGAVHRGGL
jgi:hypothetical protein